MRGIELRGLALALGWLVAGSAWAGAPGSADRKAALPNVCAAGPLQGEDCDPTESAPCGVRGKGVPYACVVDFPANPTLRGTLTLVADDDVGDNDTAGANPTLTMLIEVGDGSRTFFFAETFQGGNLGEFPEVGGWNPPLSEDEIDQIESSFVFQTPVEALGPLGLALQEAAEQIFGRRFDSSGTIPVFFDLRPEPSVGDPIDEYTDADLGQVARFRIEIKFVVP